MLESELFPEVALAQRAVSVVVKDPGDDATVVKEVIARQESDFFITLDLAQTDHARVLILIGMVALIFVMASAVTLEGW